MILSRERTLIILDWDDTLFPTTWVTTHSINIKNLANINSNLNSNLNSVLSYFIQIDKELLHLLQILMKFGHVAIITNAMLNWINISSTILPKTSKLLKSDSAIEIISARGSFQDKSSDPMDWKKFAFAEIIKNKKYKKVNNIISIGDAEYEYKALINLYQNGGEKNNGEKNNGEKNNGEKKIVLLKSVKFVKYPTNHVLLDQIKVMQEASYKVATQKTHLDLRFELKN